MLPAPEELAAKVRARSDADQAAADEVAAESLALVGRQYTLAGLDPETDTTVPEAIANRACLDVALELHARAGIRHGIVQLGDVDGVTPMRVNRDPASVAASLLAPWFGPGIGA